MSADLELVSRWNRRLQIDEGAAPMEPAEIAARLRRWLAGGIYLRQFFVAPEHRRSGLGTQAFAHLVDHAVRGRRLVLEALASNPGGQAFWRSLGLRVYSTTFELPPDPGR